jgi:hypothetical protein
MLWPSTLQYDIRQGDQETSSLEWKPKVSFLVEKNQPLVSLPEWMPNVGYHVLKILTQILSLSEIN